MSSSEVALSEIEKAVQWARKNRRNGRFLDKRLLETVIKRTEEKRESHSTIQGAKNHALLELCAEYSMIRKYRDDYSATVGRYYSMHRHDTERTARHPEEQPVLSTGTGTDIFTRIAAQTEGWHRDED